MSGGTIADCSLHRNQGEAPRSKGNVRAPVRRALALLHPWTVGRPTFWLTVAMVVIGAALHYGNPLAFRDADGQPHLTRHSMDRVLLMVPVVYAGFIFGPRGGFITLVAVTLLMLPRALFQSSSPPDAIVEVASIVLVSILIILWFRGQEQERGRRMVVLNRLEMARQELASQVEIITKDERRLAAINEICRVVTQSLDLPDILQRILGKIIEEMGVSAGLIFLRDKAGRELELVAHEGISQECAWAIGKLQIGEGLNGLVAWSGEPLVIEDATDDPRLAVAKVREEGLRSQLIVPLQSKGVTIGTLCVAVRSSRRFTEDDIELLGAVGSQVGIAIENARLYHEARTSEERYRDLFENATVAIYVHDREGVITAANKATAKLTGYQLSELIGMNIGELLAGEAAQTLNTIEQSLCRGEVIGEPFDLSIVKRNGTEAIVSLTARPVGESGKPAGFQHIARDVTERRRMRETLNYYVRQVLTAQEEERKRIARELHDETAQSLLLILQRIDALSSGPTGGPARQALRRLDELRAIVLQALDDLRRLTRDLRPQILDDLGLVAAVEWLAEEMEKKHGVLTQVRVRGEAPPLSPEEQLLLFRIAQEALSNVRRHAAASQASVALEFEEGAARVVVEDNGRGFRLPADIGELARSGKLGLMGMSERARLAGGSIRVLSAPGKGTRVVAQLATN